MAGFGLIPFRSRSVANWSSRITRYKKEASVILGIGDPVILAGGSETTEHANSGIPLVTRATADLDANTLVGVVVGRDPDPSDLTKRGFLAADKGYVYVLDHRDVEFIIQEDGDTTPLAAAAVGTFADFATIGNANTSTWNSTVQLDSSTATTDGDLYIVELLQRADNAIMATTASTLGLWVVMMGVPQFQ
jgi:hypothetical protein